MVETDVPKVPIRRLYLFAAGLILFAIFGQVMFFKFGSPLGIQAAASKLKIKATLMDEQRPLPEFILMNHKGETFTQDDLKGRWTLVSFGYTSCSVDCRILPSIYDRIDGLMEGAAFEYPPEFVFVTVDPEHDTPAQLSTYLAGINSKIMGLTGEQYEINIFTREVNAVVGNDSDPDKEAVNLDSPMLIVNPEGMIHAVAASPLNADVIARDYRNIVTLAAGVESAR